MGLQHDYVEDMYRIFSINTRLRFSEPVCKKLQCQDVHIDCEGAWHFFVHIMIYSSTSFINFSLSFVFKKLK